MRAACPWWAPPLLAVQFLTRIPVFGLAHLSPDAARAGLVRAVGWFPLVGGLVGAITATVALGVDMIWPVYVAVPLALIVEARLTGAFHEDAVADFCDAFGGGQSADDVRRIMKDSRIGSYGSVGLILAIGLRAALLIALIQIFSPLMAGFAIVASASFGRLLTVVMMPAVRPAPSNAGLAKDIASGVGASALVLAVLTSLPVLLPFAMTQPERMLAAIAAAALFAAWFRQLLLRRIGGSTGDCLGFAAYAGQLILLMAAVAVLPG